MYTLSRQDVADKLGISTRSVDRYVKSGKLRSKKEGKTIFIHTQDVANLAGEYKVQEPEVIIPENKKSSFQESVSEKTQSLVDPKTSLALEKIYIDLRQEIKQKDATIQDLAIKLWQAQEIAKNSVSLVEFKKSQFLLEESKWHMNHELESLRKEKETLLAKLKYEKTTTLFLIIGCVALIVASGFLLFMKA